MTSSKNIQSLFSSLLIIALLLFVSSALFAQTPFQHTTASNNISAHITTLDHASTNGKARSLLFVSQLYGKYNAHQVGVWYNGGKWKIYNEDKVAMPVGTKCNGCRPF